MQNMRIPPSPFSLNLNIFCYQPPSLPPLPRSFLFDFLIHLRSTVTRQLHNVTVFNPGLCVLRSDFIGQAASHSHIIGRRETSYWARVHIRNATSFRGLFSNKRGFLGAKYMTDETIFDTDHDIGLFVLISKLNRTKSLLSYGQLKWPVGYALGVQ